MNNYMPTNWTTWAKWKIPRKIKSPKTNQKESETLNRYITPNETEAVIKKLPTNKCPGPAGFKSKFYQTF